jgi:hypothetical protein
MSEIISLACRHVNAYLHEFSKQRTISFVDHLEFASMGGRARAKALTKMQLKAAARKAANARWAKPRLVKKKTAA